MGALFDRVNLKRTRVLVISKSGGTAETMSQYLVVREKLEQLGADWPKRVLRFITDPEKGVLRAIAKVHRGDRAGEAWASATDHDPIIRQAHETAQRRVGHGLDATSGRIQDADPAGRLAA